MLNFRQKNKKIMQRNESLILWLDSITAKDGLYVGLKALGLADIVSLGKKHHIKTPPAFVLTREAFDVFFEQNDLTKDIKYTLLRDLDIYDDKNIAQISKKIQQKIMRAELPSVVVEALQHAYTTLSREMKKKNVSVAVRSSVIAEDLLNVRFRDMHESLLYISGSDSLMTAVKKCIASLYSVEALRYRETKGIEHTSIAMPVIVQAMVSADTMCSGTVSTQDSATGFQGIVQVRASYGLGVHIDQGISADEYTIAKAGIQKDKHAIISRTKGSKEKKYVLATRGGTKQMRVKKSDRDAWTLSDADICELAEISLAIEQYYHEPVTLQWAQDQKTKTCYILHVDIAHRSVVSPTFLTQRYTLKNESDIILQGRAIGQKIATGKVRIITKLSDMIVADADDIVVMHRLQPDMAPYMRNVAGIITEVGGSNSHAAILAREMGIPCVIGVVQACSTLRQKQQITLSCVDGQVGTIYKGILPFEVHDVDVSVARATKTGICINIGDPQNAFDLAALPSDGVGLVRNEFLMAHTLQVHPLALVHYKKITSKKLKKSIDDITHEYDDKVAYGVDTLAEGIARIATAFYPRQVVVRFSDIKSDEYASLIGSKEYEQKEKNAMHGFRGAERYYSKKYKPAFQLECDAIKKVRNEWGLTNVVVMVPFCRTPEEGQRVLDTMKECGLPQGEHDLKVHVMCEIPSNVVLAEEFAHMFDGVSIGTNDLTQLTLGIDRNSSTQGEYDERHDAVTRLIRDVIKVMHKHKKPIGVCGQALNEYPEFVDMLVRQRVDSISLNPDNVLSVRQHVSRMEKTLGKRVDKTSPTYVAFVGMFAALAAGFVMIGGGCSMLQQHTPTQDISSEPSIAQIREKLEQNIEKRYANTHAYRIYEERNFAEFSIQYPYTWHIQRLDQGISFTNPDSTEFVSLFIQQIPHQVLPDNKNTLFIDDKSAVSFDIDTYDGQKIHVVEVYLDDDSVLEINTNYADFATIQKSLLFTSGLDEDTTICAQVITFAKESDAGNCVAFSTPCQVPEGWMTCSTKQ